MEQLPGKKVYSAQPTVAKNRGESCPVVKTVENLRKFKRQQINWMTDHTLCKAMLCINVTVKRITEGHISEKISRKYLFAISY